MAPVTVHEAALDATTDGLGDGVCDGEIVGLEEIGLEAEDLALIAEYIGLAVQNAYKSMMASQKARQAEAALRKARVRLVLATLEPRPGDADLFDDYVQFTDTENSVSTFGIPPTLDVAARPGASSRSRKAPRWRRRSSGAGSYVVRRKPSVRLCPGRG